MCQELVGGSTLQKLAQRSNRTRFRTRVCGVLPTLLSAGAFAGLWASTLAMAAEPDPALPARYGVRLQTNVRIPMRDGARMAADIYFPEGAKGRLPAVLIRTPYDKKEWRKEPSSPRRLAEQGLVTVVEDLRGSFQSEGVQTLLGHTNAEDGYDTVNWIVSQPWSNANAATFGCSAQGWVQLVLAPLRHPHIRTMIIGSPGGMGLRNGMTSRESGILELQGAASWYSRFGSRVTLKPSRPLKDSEYASIADEFDPALRPSELPADALKSLPVVDILHQAGGPPSLWDDIVKHPIDDPWWNGVEGFAGDSSVDTPVLWVNSWNDGSASDTIELFNYFRRTARSTPSRDNQYLVLSPAEHCATEYLTSSSKVGPRELGDARIHLMDIYVKWLRGWLDGEKPAPAEKMPHIQYYVMGANVWRSTEQWPPAGSKPTRFHLSSVRRANSRAGDGELALKQSQREQHDTLTYDPATPVPSDQDVIADQRQTEEREDVLVYTSAPLTQMLTLTGRVNAKLYVSSDAPDTDFFVRLVDVAPDGTALNVTQGAAQLRYRQGLGSHVLANPGEIYELNVDLHDTALTLAPGHRVRLDLTSSDFPRFVRNLNTGGDNVTETTTRIARNSVHHGPQHDSYLELTVAP